MNLLTLFAAFALSTSPLPEGGLRAPHAPDPIPWNIDEHRLLADSALVQTLRLFGSGGDIATPFGFDLDVATPIANGETFSDLVARFAADDGGAGRFQVAQKTVLDQLSDLTVEDLERLWEGRPTPDQAAGSLPLSQIPKNAVAMYLAHHLMALRSAEAAAALGTSGEAEFRAMLAYEAAAQGFLQDALSSAHMLTPRHDFLPALHATNTKAAHRYYAIEGVYVINGLGTAYEAFGDGVLPYFSSAFDAAQDAARSSLATVLYAYLVRGSQSVPPLLEAEIQKQTGGGSTAGLVDSWLTSQSGSAYYADTRLPGLLHIPTPVAATWSIRDPQTGERKHTLQLAEEGYHDPDLLDELKDYLPSKDEVPLSLRPEDFGSDEAARAAIDTVRNLASVEFVQDFRVHASYDGVVIEVGAGTAYAGEEWKPAISTSVGLGADNFLVVEDLAVLAGATFIVDRPSVFRLTGATNFGDSPVRLELGVGTTTAHWWDTMGLAIGGAIDLIRFDHGFAYGGGLLRLRYDGKIFREMVHSFTLQVALH